VRPLAVLLRVLGPPVLAAVLFVAVVLAYAALPDDQPSPDLGATPASRGGAKTTGPTLLAIVDKPIPAYTPGATAAEIRTPQLCPHLSPAWAAARRTLGTADRRLTMARYGIANPDRVSEWDHLIPRELAGADTIANIWPQTDRPTDQRKDRLENLLHRQVCAGQLALTEAQHRAVRYWEWW
jgi:hypothetical protein